MQSETAQIRVVVADDQPLVRAGLVTLLEREGDITVVDEAADGADAINAAHTCQPDIVLMDVRMPGVDGITATKTITDNNKLSAVRVIVLTTFDTDEHIFDSIAAGAAGFVLKNTAPADLRAALRTVAAGDALLSPSVTTRVLAQLASHGDRRDRAAAVQKLADITLRERDVLHSVSRGYSNDEIAAELFLSPATVRTYVSRMMIKLDARTRAELVVIAYESGLR